MCKRACIKAMALLIGCYASCARAADDWCGVTLPTPDGFVNVRSGPGTEYPVVFQATTGSILWGYVGAGQAAPKWIAIHAAATKAGNSTESKGYVNTRYVVEIDCNMLTQN